MVRAGPRLRRNRRRERAEADAAPECLVNQLRVLERGVHAAGWVASPGVQALATADTFFDQNCVLPPSSLRCELAAHEKGDRSLRFWSPCQLSTNAPDHMKRTLLTSSN